MKLVAVTRIMNEDDIVEAFVRHHAGQIDHHLFLDNGSVDRTVEILAALKREGIPLSVLQNTAPFFVEPDYNTNLLHIAAHTLGADWVLFLDADEFVDSRTTPDGLRVHVESVPAAMHYLGISTTAYAETDRDDGHDLLVPRRMRYRYAAPDVGNIKVFARATLAVEGAEVEAGQHGVTVRGKTVPGRADESLMLAHYYRRTPYQALWKNTLGRLKVLAAGRQEVEKQRSSHYTDVFEVLRDAPEKLLRDPVWMEHAHDPARLVDDPIRYEGGALRYTEPMDGQIKAIRVVLGYADRLAREFGEALDADATARQRAIDKARTWTRLL